MTLNHKSFAKRNSSGLSPLQIPISDPKESLRILAREHLREGLAVVATTSRVDLAAQMLDVDQNLHKRYLPTREQIARECSAIRKKWSPAERAKRWRGRSTNCQQE